MLAATVSELKALLVGENKGVFPESFRTILPNQGIVAPIVVPPTPNKIATPSL